VGRNDVRILGDADIDRQVLEGRRIGILGFGNQGRAQALCLRDGGHAVRIGARPGGDSSHRAARAGFRVGPLPEVARWANVILLLVPDEVQPELLATIAAALEPGDAVGFAHGVTVAFDLGRVPPGVGVFLVAPCAPGDRLRDAYVRGEGVFAYVATREEDAHDLPLALAYAAAIGCGRAGVVVTTIRREAEVDLFGEQAVLCGGMHALLLAACDTLIEAGVEPELAYLECVHQLVWLAATVQRHGITGTRRRISTTARYGDVTRGPRVINDGSRAALRGMLEEIQSGSFVEEFLAAGRRGFPAVLEEIERLEEHPIEVIGRRLRARLVRRAAPDDPGSAEA
jgi:ketol-acid reductoisomerase